MKAAALACAVIALATTGIHLTGASFTTTTQNPSTAVAAARIFPAIRAQSAWSISDASGPGAADKSDPLGFPDGRLLSTSAASTAFAANRYIEFDYDSVVPAGLVPQAVTFNFDFADDNADAKQTCVYFEVRRASTGTLLGTYGSAVAPIACGATAIQQETSTSIASAVTTTDVADDLRIRVYARDEGNNTFRIDRATVTTKAYGKTWTEYPQLSTDQLDTTPATITWGPAKSDTSSYQNAANWPSTFSTTKYIELTFPSNVPGSGTLTSATFENRYSSSAAGSNACVYYEFYSGDTLIGSRGSSASAYSCNNTTTPATDSFSMPELSTPALANGVTVRIYGRSAGGDRTNHDLVDLRLAYSLGSTGCTDTGPVTVTATRDTWADQNNPTSVTGGTNASVNVKSQSGSRNRRGFIYFPLPSIGDGCSVQGATLRLYQTNTQGTRTVEVLRAASTWAESTLSWNVQPAPTGTAVGTLATSTNAWVTWNVGTLVGQLYSGSNFGFYLRDSAEDSATAAEQKFSSREGAKAPELVVTMG